MKTSQQKLDVKSDRQYGLYVHPYQDLKLSEEWSLIEGDVLENMRLLVTRLQKNGSMPKRLSVLSSISGEGVTTVCLGMGITAANDYRKKTCIVDLNWYSPSTLYQAEEGDPGIANIIEDNLSIEEIVRPTGITGLYILPAGKLEDYKRPIIARSQSLADLFEQLDVLFDHIILDIPAVLSTSDSVPLAGHGDGCCVVIRQGVTPVLDVKMALNEISHLTMLGVIVNRVSLHTPAKIVKFMGG